MGQNLQLGLELVSRFVRTGCLLSTALLAWGCATRHKVDVSMIFLDERGEHRAAGEQVIVSERKGSVVLASLVEVGRLVICDDGRSRLQGEYDFPILVRGHRMFSLIQYDQVRGNTDVAIEYKPYGWAVPDEDFPLLNQCDDD